MLAATDADRWDAILVAPLARSTVRAIDDPQLLREQLGRIHRQGFAEGKGEENLSIAAGRGASDGRTRGASPRR